MSTALPIPRLVRQIAQEVHREGGQALLVGGGVRDHLLGRPTKDWDIEVHRVPPKALHQLLQRVDRVSLIGRSFGVFKVHHHDLDLDVSLPRTDSRVGPGHRGIQATGDPFLGTTEAARRRDLTVNAMMIDLHTEELLDPWNGRADLAARRLHPVDPDTFLEDPLRAVRAVQFAARLDFQPSPELIELCARAPLEELPHERILGEWAKLLLRGERPSRGLDLARRARILPRLFPDHRHPVDVDAALDRAVPSRAQLGPSGRQLAYMAVVWLHQEAPPAWVATLDQLRLHRYDGFRTREVTLAALDAWDRPCDTDADLRHLSAACDAEVWLHARQAADERDLGDHLRRLRHLGLHQGPPRPLLSGKDLRSLGSPGPWMGQLLRQVYEAQLDGQITDREGALDLARRLHTPSP